MDKEYLEWAENEVELAKKDPWDKNKEKELDCALSLLKQMNEEGLDANDVFFKLERLFYKLPLTLITEDDKFEFDTDCEDGGKLYSCKRADSLLKYVSKEGEVSYENMRYLIKDCKHHDIADSVSSLVSQILEDVDGISLPYCPSVDWVEVHVQQGKTFDSDEVNAVYIDSIVNLYPTAYNVDSYFIMDEDGHWKHVFKQEYTTLVEDYYGCDGCDCCDDEGDEEKDE